MTATHNRSTATVLALPTLPALVVGRVHHTRHTPVRHSFSNRHYQWLLDLDQPLSLPRWLHSVASFRPQDHLAGSESLAELKANVLRCLERDGIPADGVTRVVALTHARVLGHVFDPMTAYWCLTADGVLRGVVVEVHNTYGERHAYAVLPDPSGAANVDKDFYVSPFNDTTGEYAIRFHLDPRRVSVGIRLNRQGELLFTAVVEGSPVPATPRSVITTVARHPFMPQQVSTLIRMHGIRLWARRLAIQPRAASSQESVR
ncbi:MAG: DUF1365 domain-containing protein [Knoellia sp.]